MLESWVQLRAHGTSIRTEMLERLCWYGEPAYRSAVLLRPGA